MTSVRDSVLRNFSNGRGAAKKLIPTERRAKTYKLQEHERHLVRSCEQIILLNDKIRGLTKRYESAKAECFRSFRYNLRVRLAVVEGVRNVFYEYARDMAEDIADLRRELYGQNVEIITDTDGETDDEQSINDLDYDDEEEIVDDAENDDYDDEDDDYDDLNEEDAEEIEEIEIKTDDEADDDFAENNDDDMDV